jgi:hypothetical protein
MSIKVVLLKTGEKIITDIKELISEEKTCGYLLKNPVKIEKVPKIVLSESVDYTNQEISIQMSSWIEFTEDTEIPVNIETVIAIVEPLESLKNLYMEKVNGKEKCDSEVSFTEE